MASKYNEKPAPSPAAQRKPGKTNTVNLHAANNDGFTVVGIGASAGGLQALQAFFEVLPANTGMAYVVTTHLHPGHESHLAELLQTRTDMPVLQVTGSMPVEKDQVYVIPPNRGLIMEDGNVDTAKFTEPCGQRAPVDHFFRSLAKEKLQSVNEELHVHAEQQIRSLASELTATEQAKLDEKVRVLTFYAVREILSIIVKHAETLEAAIRFEPYESYLLVIVRDQWIGFNSAEVMSGPTSAHGLLNIRHRLNLLGCSMEVNSRPGKCSEAIIEVPYDKLDNSI